MTPLRVLQLADNLDVGGLERVVANLCDAGPTQAVSFYLGCLSHLGEFGERTTAAEKWVGKLRPGHFPVDLRVANSLRQFIKQHRLQVIHSHNTKAFLYGTIASLLTGIPHVQTVHGRGSAFCLDQQQQDRLRKFLTPVTEKVVAVSDDVRQKLLSIDRLPPTKVTTIVNGIDTNLYRPLSDSSQRHHLREQRGLPPDGFIIGSVGRLVAEKNYHMLVRAFALFHATHSDSHLVLVGEGTERPSIEEAIRQTKMDQHCHLAGVQHDIPDWLHCLDIFTLSSDSEGMPMTLLEAMSMELPCVTTDVGGNRSVLDPPQCGVVVPPSDPQALAAAFQKLASNHSHRLSLGQAARSRLISEFSVDHMLSEYLNLYHQVLAHQKC